MLGRGCWSEVERFGLAEVAGTGPDWTIAVDGTILLGGAAQGTLAFGQTGRHNQLNALAAIAAARHAGVPVAVSLAALAAFGGVKRRMEVRGTVDGVTVYDDFAHHPTAIAVTLDGLRRKVGGARIVAVLEPRSNTMKLGAMKDALPGSLAAADRVFCYAANLGWDAAAALAPLGAKATVHDDLDALIAAIAAEAKPGDHVLVMSNGGFGGIHAKLLARLAASVPRLRSARLEAQSIATYGAAVHRVPTPHDRLPPRLPLVAASSKAQLFARMPSPRCPTRSARGSSCRRSRTNPPPRSPASPRGSSARSARPRTNSRSSAARSAATTRRISPSASAPAPC